MGLNSFLEKKSKQYKNEQNKKAIINTKLCLAWDNVICNACQDSCPKKAIEFLGLFRPVINDKCSANNCDLCMQNCLRGAINVC